MSVLGMRPAVPTVIVATLTRGLKSSAAGIRHALLGTTALIAVGTAAIVSAGDAKAQTWNGGNGDSWGDSTKWTPGTVPNAVDAVATFNATNSVGGISIVNVGGGPFTVGTLNVNATAAAIAARSGFQFAVGGVLIMQASTGSAAINVQTQSTGVNPPDVAANLQLNSNTVITTASTSASFGVIGTVSGAGSVTISGPGTVGFSSSNSYTGGTIVNDGKFCVCSAGALGNTANSLAVNGGILQLYRVTETQNGGVTQTGGRIQGIAAALSTTTYRMTGGQLDISVNASTAFDMQAGGVSGILAGSGGLTKTTNGAVFLTGANTYTGGTIVNGGTLGIQSGASLGDTANSLAVNGGILKLYGTTQTQNGGVTQAGGTIQNGTLNTTTYQMTRGTLDSSATINASTAFDMQAGTVNGVLAGSSGLTKTTNGVVTLAGANSYTGATTVNGGTLEVDGSIAGASAVTVNTAGTLSGTGRLGATTIMSGGTLAPGNAASPTGSLNISGNLVLQSGAMYLMQVTPSAAANTLVTGTATLGGAAVNAVFANGSYIEKKYNILTTSGGVSGTFASTVANTNLPANFHTSLSYDANNAYLNLALNFTPGPSALSYGGGLSRNQQAVANAFINSFNSNGGIPLVYGALNGAGLTQASGELGTTVQQGTFVAMGQFMGLLTDPFAGRAGGPGATSDATGFADEQGASAYAARKATDAFAMFTKAPPRSFESHWSVWAEGFGGSQSTDGNAVTGSNNTTSSIYGTAVGADYLVAPNTLAGFALAGGGTNFGVNGLGSGRSDLFQAGAYVRHSNGPAYVSAALAYGWQDITTNRVVTVAGIDHLRAEFNANAWSGRLEGGYRFVAPVAGGVGITPYAAAQVTALDLPAYAEQVVSGASAFAVAYGAKGVTDTRSELGIRSDKSFAMQNGVLTLRSRFAWAHDYNPDRAVAATFQALPGASFVVNGAAQASDSALTTASAELKWANGWSAAATFEGEFSTSTRSYAGKGVVRYAW